MMGVFYGPEIYIFKNHQESPEKCKQPQSSHHTFTVTKLIHMDGGKGVRVCSGKGV